MKKVPFFVGVLLTVSSAVVLAQSNPSPGAKAKPATKDASKKVRFLGGTVSPWVCKKNQNCFVAVEVKPVDQTMPFGKCAIAVNDVIVAPMKSKDISWILDPPEAQYRFNSNAEMAIAIDGNEDSSHNKVYKVKSHASSFHKRSVDSAEATVFGYTIHVDVKDQQGNWTECGFYDPVIVSRD